MVTPKSEAGFLKGVVVESQNRQWISLLRAASREADEAVDEKLVLEARAKLEETIRHKPGWTFGPCVKAEDNLWHASASPVDAGGSARAGESVETAALNEWGALHALANLLERQGAAAQ